MPPGVHIGLVSYIDYDKELFSISNAFNFILHKRESYAHEREVRCVVWEREDIAKDQFQRKGKGLVVPVELPLLIEAVYVSPSAVDMVREVVEGLLQKYGLTSPVLQSTVNAPPAY